MEEDSKEDETKAFTWRHRGKSFYARMNKPRDKARAVIFFFHGLNNFIDHSSIRELADEAEKKNFLFFYFDQDGFGKSALTTTGQLGYVESWHNMVTDAYAFISDMIYEHDLKDLTFFTMGCSMGGTVCLVLSLHTQDKGGIWKNNYGGTLLLAPAILNSLEPHWSIILILKLVVFFGGSTNHWGPPANYNGWKEYEPDVPMEKWKIRVEQSKITEFEESNLSTFPSRMILGTGLQLLHMTQYLILNLNSVKTPFFCIHGKGDATIPVESSNLLMKSAKSEDKNLKIYDNLCHSILCDFMWPDIREECWDWINQRLKT